MKKTILLTIPILLLLLTGCSLLQRAVDKRFAFSKELAALEQYIGSENWEEAGKSELQSLEKWEKVKPWIQLEIDHDVVNEIETKLIELSGYLETKDKSASLASIRVVINTWEDIGAK